MCQCSGHTDRERELVSAIRLLIRSMDAGQYQRESAVVIAIEVIRKDGQDQEHRRTIEK